MDYVGPVLLFVIGFLAAFVAARGWRWSRASRGFERGFVDKGVVRLDLLAGGTPRLEMAETAAGQEELPPAAGTASVKTAKAPEEKDSSAVRRTRKHQRG